MRRLNLQGRTFGRLAVLCSSGSNVHGKSTWICVCECGGQIETVGQRLLRGVTLSCGCLAVENAKQVGSMFSHGDSRRGAISPEYHAWASMHGRCYNPRHKSYKDYGGRGIKVSREWHSFDTFLRDMGRRPSPSHSLERKKVNGNYSCTNCKWATVHEQANNRRNNRVVRFKGVSRTITQWAEVTGIPRSVLYARLKLGWTARRAFNTPVRSYLNLSKQGT